MAVQRPREIRQPVRIGARLRSARGWGDVVIRNVSSRGVMGECGAPPVRGDYVEVRCGACVIVARVAWSEDDRFGALAQGRIQLSELVAGSQGRALTVPERRKRPRAEHVAPRGRGLTERAAASARLGRALDFSALALAGAAFAVVVAGSVHDALARPLTEISQKLATEQGR
jgi:hypothetical protein